MRIWNKDETQQGFITWVHYWYGTFCVEWEDGQRSSHVRHYPLHLRYVTNAEQKRRWFEPSTGEPSTGEPSLFDA